jgi:hypothetical protein
MAHIYVVYLLIASITLPFGVIIGYDPNKVMDKEGLGKWVGSNFILIGIYSIMFAILSYFVQTLMIGIWMLGFAIIIARTMIGERKYYEKK